MRMNMNVDESRDTKDECLVANSIRFDSIALIARAVGIERCEKKGRQTYLFSDILWLNATVSPLVMHTNEANNSTKRKMF